jgi:Protein of unknown function (DUF2917)
MRSGKEHRLRRDEWIRLEGDVAGRIISCREGVLWLTQTGNPGDHLIRSGEAFSVEHPGLVLISALEDSACVVSDRKSIPLRPVWCVRPAFCKMARRFEEVLRKSLLT